MTNRWNSFTAHGVLWGDNLRHVVGVVIPWHFKLQNVRKSSHRQRMSAAINAHDSKPNRLERFTVQFFGERSWRKVDVDRLAGER